MFLFNKPSDTIIKRIVKRTKRVPPPQITINDTAYKLDPYLWLHKYDRLWFLRQFHDFAAQKAADEIQLGALVYCYNLPIHEIRMTYAYQVYKGKHYYTFAIVLDLLSAAYGVALIPGLPTKEGKELAQIFLDRMHTQTGEGPKLQYDLQRVIWQKGEAE